MPNIKKCENDININAELPVFFRELFDPILFVSGIKESKTVSPKYHFTKEGVEIDVPGVDESEISLEVEKDVLSISANRKFEDGEDLYEREYSISFTIKDSVNKEEISASFKNGVLKVKLPKKQENKKKILIS